MIVDKIILAGNPNLSMKSLPVTDFYDPELKLLIDDLFDTMAAHNGAGLCAPQIGVQKRVIVYGFTKNPRYPDQKPVPKTALINPEIIELSEETNGLYEGCLSLTNLRGMVPRSTNIRYKGYLSDGTKIEKVASGFEARIIQHEIDHLDGILFPSRMTDITTLAMYDELKKHQVH